MCKQSLSVLDDWKKYPDIEYSSWFSYNCPCILYSKELITMNKIIKKEVRFLKAYAIVITLILGVLIFSGFKQNSQKPRFDEIDVERINIVEKDGQLKMVISNKERAPGPIIGGKTLSRQGGNSPGMIFYNEKGDECGGLIFHSQEEGDKYGAGAALLFDQYNQDQTVGIMYNEGNGQRTAGFHVWDRPDTHLLEIWEKLQAVRKMDEGPEKKEAMKKLEEEGKRGEFGARRVFVGKNRDKAAEIALSDTRGQPRIHIKVNKEGVPSIDFLDENGEVIYSLPQDLKTAQK